MTYKDQYNILYKTIKKNDKYYLLKYLKNSNTKDFDRIIEVKGKENIAKFIKNNRLKRCEDER